ncbi:MAG: hypothetical protein WB721_06235, partial [Pseudolabrys sp.]
ATTMRDHMRTKDLQASDEKRAYYRLLRYLVSDELHTCYEDGQGRPLQPQITDFLKVSERHEPFKIH